MLWYVRTLTHSHTAKGKTKAFIEGIIYIGLGGKSASYFMFLYSVGFVVVVCSAFG